MTELSGKHRIFTPPILDDEGNAKGSPPPADPTDVPTDQVEEAKAAAGQK
jgi:hypothetical protein